MSPECLSLALSAAAAVVQLAPMRLVLYSLKTWETKLYATRRKKNNRKISLNTIWSNSLKTPSFPSELNGSIRCHYLLSAVFCCVLICFDTWNNKWFKHKFKSCFIHFLRNYPVEKLEHDVLRQWTKTKRTEKSFLCSYLSTD